MSGSNIESAISEVNWLQVCCVLRSSIPPTKTGWASCMWQWSNRCMAWKMQTHMRTHVRLQVLSHIFAGFPHWTRLQIATSKSQLLISCAEKLRCQKQNYLVFLCFLDLDGFAASGSCCSLRFLEELDLCPCSCWSARSAFLALGFLVLGSPSFSSYFLAFLRKKRNLFQCISWHSMWWPLWHPLYIKTSWCHVMKFIF